MRRAGRAPLGAITGGGRHLRVTLALVSALVVAAGWFPSLAGSVPTPGNGRGGAEALLEVFVEGSEWTPAEGWPWEIGSLGGEKITWGELTENRDVSIEGGAETGVSVERIARLEGVPQIQISGMVVCNTKPETVTNKLGRAESEQVCKQTLTYKREEIFQGEAPFFEPEGNSIATSSIAFVSPPNNAQPARLESPETGTTRVILKTSTGLLQVAKLTYSPLEPNAGEPIKFNKPEVTNAEIIDENHSYKYLWTFGDGATSTEPAPTHTYQRNGTSGYTVYAEVTALNTSGEEIAAGSTHAAVVLKAGSATPLPPPTTTSTTPPEEPPPPKEEEHILKHPIRHPPQHHPRHHHHHHHPKPKHHKPGPSRVPTSPGLGIAETGEGEGLEGQGHNEPGTAPTTNELQPHTPTAPPLEKPPPVAPKAPTRQLQGLTGELMNSAGRLSPAAAPGGTTKTVSPFHFASTPPSRLSPLGAVGLIAGIAIVLLAILFGAFGELLATRFVR